MKKITSFLSVFAFALALISCSSDTDELSNNEVGYLKLDIETNTTTHEKTRAGAPAFYDAKKLHVEVKNEAGAIVAQTDDFENDTELNGAQIILVPGLYTVVAHSYNWDGNGSGFNTPYYYGETEVTVKSHTLSTAKITCTLANVKVSVNFSEEFQTSFARATSTVESALAGISAQAFTMGSNKGSAYFPVGNLTANLSVFSKSGEGHSSMHEIKNVQARDHYIINYTVAASGNQGNVTVKVDPTTRTYTYTFEVPSTSSISVAAYAANAWSTIAFVDGVVTCVNCDFDATKLSLQYKATDATVWTDVANDALTISGDEISCKISNLTPETEYVYHFVYDINGVDKIFSKDVTFTTESQPALYNGGFEDWYDVGDYYSPNKDANTKYWDSLNPGMVSMIKRVLTSPETSFVHGGSKSAKLASDFALVRLFPGSIYTGQFDALDQFLEVIYWGVPFTGRPTGLHGFKRYIPGKINRGQQPSGVGAPAKGSDDIGIIRVALLTEQLHVSYKDISTFPNWQTDPRIIGYGVWEFNSTDNDWVEFNIPIEYHSMTKKPAYILVMGATSKFGDYSYGSDSSVMYLDDFELVYGDTPVTNGQGTASVDRDTWPADEDWNDNQSSTNPVERDTWPADEDWNDNQSSSTSVERDTWPADENWNDNQSSSTSVERDTWPVDENWN